MSARFLAGNTREEKTVTEQNWRSAERGRTDRGSEPDSGKCTARSNIAGNPAALFIARKNGRAKAVEHRRRLQGTRHVQALRRLVMVPATGPCADDLSVELVHQLVDSGIKIFATARRRCRGPSRARSPRRAVAASPSAFHRQQHVDVHDLVEVALLAAMEAAGSGHAPRWLRRSAPAPSLPEIVLQAARAIVHRVVSKHSCRLCARCTELCVAHHHRVPVLMPIVMRIDAAAAAPPGWR